MLHRVVYYELVQTGFKIFNLFVLVRAVTLRALLSQYHLRLPPLFAVFGVERFSSNSSLVDILARDGSNIALQPRPIFVS